MWSTGRVGHIDSFYVLPGLRGRGVGRLLMEAAYAQMRQAGASTVALEMVDHNDVASRFYEREGFTTTFVQMHRRLEPSALNVRRAEIDHPRVHAEIVQDPDRAPVSGDVEHVGRHHHWRYKHQRWPRRIIRATGEVAP